MADPELIWLAGVLEGDGKIMFNTTCAKRDVLKPFLEKIKDFMGLRRKGQIEMLLNWYEENPRQRNRRLP